MNKRHWGRCSHRKLSHISLKTFKKNISSNPLFFTGRKLRPLGIGIEAPVVAGLLQQRAVEELPRYTAARRTEEIVTDNEQRKLQRAA